MKLFSVNFQQRFRKKQIHLILLTGKYCDGADMKSSMIYNAPEAQPSSSTCMFSYSCSVLTPGRSTLISVMTENFEFISVDLSKFEVFGDKGGASGVQHVKT